MKTYSIIWVMLLLFGLTVDSRHNSTEPNSSSDIVASPQYPLERARWWAEIQGPPPSNAQLDRARQVFDRQIRVRQRSDYRDAGISDWEDLGPKNVGGRIRALAIHPNDPNEIFIGSVSGGVWKSSDGGTNWTESTPAPLAYPITSLTIDPDNPNNIYASTGEYVSTYLSWNTIPGVDLAWANPPGVGVLKSTNGGATWSIANRPDTNFLWLNKVILNPLDPAILYAVGSTADTNQFNVDRRAVFRSNDAGDSWTQLWGGGGNPEHVMDIEINPSDTSELIIGTLSNVYISNNSGTSWTSLLGASPLITTPMGLNRQRCEVAYCQSSPSTIYVLRYLTATNITTSQLWQTTDGGTNWTLLSTSTGGPNTSVLGGQGNYDNIIWADPSNCNRAIMGGVNLWKWSNSTLTRISQWQDDIGGNNAPNGNDNSVHADQHIIVPDPNYNGSTNARVYIGNDGGIYKSDTIWGATANSGWLSLNNELNITQLYSVDVSVTGDTLVAGTQDNSYCAYRAGDGDPQFWAVYSTGDGAHCAIKKSDPEIIYTATQNANCYKSLDGGDTYCLMLSLSGANFLTCNPVPLTSINENPLFIAPFEMDPNDDETIYSGAQRLWQSKDEGGSWTSLYTTTDVISTIEIAKGDTNNIWVGLRNGQIWQTSNGGTNWGQVTAPAMPGNIVTDLAINPNNHNEVIVTFGSGFTNIAVWYTGDGGSNWSDRSPNFDTRVYSVTWHPEVSDWVYIGTAFGVLASENDGQTWNITPLFSGNNDGPVFTAITELVWQGNGSTEHPYHLVAATYGRGAWRTQFPIREKYYVDKTCNPCGLGTFARPFVNFPEAVEVAGNGSEIIFLSGGTYNSAPPTLVVDKRLDIRLDAASSAVLLQ